MTYTEFKRLNKENKSNNMPTCRIIGVDLKNDTCSLLVDNAECKSVYNIVNLLSFIQWKTIGYIKNPSAIRNWHGWSDRFKL